MQGNPASTAKPATESPKAKAPLGAAPPHTGLSAGELIAQLESEPAAFNTDLTEAELKAESEAKVEKGKGGKGEKEQEAKAKEQPEGETDPEEAEETEETFNAEHSTAKVELSAEQTAWLEQRAAARTPEEAAAIDKTSPEFSDAQWKAAEEQFNAERGTRNAETETPAVATLAAERDQLKTDLDAQSKRLKEVEGELAQAQTQPVAIAPMNPLMVASADELAQAERNAAQLKQWCLKHWDGTEAVDASGNQPAQPAYSAEQVRTAFARADDQLSRVIPAAKEYHQIFETENASAQQTYPALFDANSEALSQGAPTPHQTRTNILRRLPGLKAGLPQISMVMGDALLGETIRNLVLAEQRTPEAKVLAEALVKAAPSLAKFMPALTGPKAAAKPIGRLPAKPIVPLARPSAGGRALPPRPSGKTKGAPEPKRFQTLLTDNSGDQLAALTETLQGVNVE